jgi:hypothetical protein
MVIRYVKNGDWNLEIIKCHVTLLRLSMFYLNIVQLMPDDVFTIISLKIIYNNVQDHKEP